MRAVAASPHPPPRDLTSHLAALRAEIEAALDQVLPPADSVPAIVHEAMRYSVLGPGKRIRPLLCLLAADAAGGAHGAAMPAACAIELVHAFSLVHDDLPCMDDDDLRRGRPTCHVRFGDANALLAGDALLALAFAHLARNAPPRHAAALVTELAGAAGSQELIGGQVLDLAAEGAAVGLAELEQIHRRKTGALIRFALRAGALCQDAPPAEVAALDQFGAHLGLVFQITDDILNVTATTDQIGKPAGSDERRAKATYPRLLGLAGARERAAQQLVLAHAALTPLGDRAARLRQIADLVLSRSR